MLPQWQQQQDMMRRQQQEQMRRQQQEQMHRQQEQLRESQERMRKQQEQMKQGYVWKREQERKQQEKQKWSIKNRLNTPNPISQPKPQFTTRSYPQPISQGSYSLQPESHPIKGMLTFVVGLVATIIAGLLAGSSFDSFTAAGIVWAIGVIITIMLTRRVWNGE